MVAWSRLTVGQAVQGQPRLRSPGRGKAALSMGSTAHPPRIQSREQMRALWDLVAVIPAKVGWVVL